MPEDDRADQRRINDEGKRIHKEHNSADMQMRRSWLVGKHKREQAVQGEKHSEAREGGTTHRQNHVLLRRGHNFGITPSDEKRITEGARTERHERDKNG